MTRDGNLVYTDYRDNTINLVTDGQIQPLVKLQEWKPYGLCRLIFDVLLVLMDNNTGKKNKVVSYSGFRGKKEKKRVGRSRSAFLFIGIILL